MPIDLKTLLKGNVVHFSHYRKGYLYYTITEVPPLGPVETDPSWLVSYCFPVPLEDVGDATFNATEKAILFMRYIRKAQEEGSFVKAL